MTKTQTALIRAALYAAAITNSLTASTIDLPQYGFAIEALDAPASSTAATTALMTFLPVSEGFAPNINVNIQPYPGNIKDYIALSKDQFKTMKWEIIAETQIGGNEWRVEYAGPMQGNDLHFYARAIANGGRVYLATGTAKQSQWDSVSSTLRRAVDAFKTK